MPQKSKIKSETIFASWVEWVREGKGNAILIGRKSTHKLGCRPTYQREQGMHLEATEFEHEQAEEIEGKER
ncbi:hypothetical protein NC653_036862 [Populus alba x Populus x berolinensis]|uniref:Uncharacterized protein n=1 Tax=Populus alba x Populus x berolinensis TaxID=444605 RepID=A0AAD6PWA5_9ROSI|nr:hypothetical protein NC653_036862 [Populus alba x Populus x berolinensis]